MRGYVCRTFHSMGEEEGGGGMVDNLPNPEAKARGREPVYLKNDNLEVAMELFYYHSLLLYNDWRVFQ